MMMLTLLKEMMIDVELVGHPTYVDVGFHVSKAVVYAQSHVDSHTNYYIMLQCVS
jgi:tryptophanyl-tRNA synthetase